MPDPAGGRPTACVRYRDVARRGDGVAEDGAGHRGESGWYQTAGGVSKRDELRQQTAVEKVFSVRLVIVENAKL